MGHSRFVVTMHAAVVAACSYNGAQTGDTDAPGPDDPADAEVLMIADARADAPPPPPDGRPDASPPDAEPGVPDAAPIPDAPMATCAGYTTVAGAFPIGATYRGSTGAAWVDARLDCQLDGGNLVVIDNAEEAAGVATLVQDDESPFFWVGVFDPSGGADNDWTSVLGGAPNYQPWAGGEPDGGTQNCVLLSDFGAPHEFFDWSCGAPQFYVCECLP